jgi:hypothetical protein
MTAPPAKLRLKEESTMTRRRLLISGLALLAIFATAMGPRLYRNMNPPPISPERSAHLKEGMTPKEVEMVIGLPPGEYVTEERAFSGTFCFGAEPCLIWSGDEGTIVVHLNYDGRADNVRFFAAEEYSFPVPGPSLFKRLQTWLGL